MSTTTKAGTLVLTGISGRKHTFEVYEYGTNFGLVACVYTVTRQSPAGLGNSHTVIYVGQTENLGDRFTGHHKEHCFRSHRANRICVLRDNDERSRLAIEMDLVAAYAPPCNG